MYVYAVAGDAFQRVLPAVSGTTAQQALHLLYVVELPSMRRRYAGTSHMHAGAVSFASSRP